MQENLYFVNIQNRGLIHIEGPDRHEFLQNLITNDLNRLKLGHALYACLLTPQGKFLHDFFITQGDGFLLLDCEGGARAQDLYNRLNTYRLRADVQISVEENHTVFGVLSSSSPRRKPGPSSDSSEDPGLRRDDGIVYFPDPRHPEMGWRSFEKPQNIEELPFSAWDERRIRLTIPDGSRDLIPGQSTMDEAHMDRLNAIDYQKGCYVGQELTARMHYRGLGKKHLYTVELPNLRISESQKKLEANSEILRFRDSEILAPDGRVIGELRSSCGDVALALVKDEFRDLIT